MQPIALVVARGLLLYLAAILGKGFVVAFYDVRLIVALLDGCVLLGIFAVLALGAVHAILGILAVLALGAVHAIFGVLAVLALGDVHASSNVLTKPDLGIFALLVVAWRNVVIVASCEGQHFIFDCCVGVIHILPLHMSVIVVAPCDTT
jgi:hypothetical protein